MELMCSCRSCWTMRGFKGRYGSCIPNLCAAELLSPAHTAGRAQSLLFGQGDSACGTWWEHSCCAHIFIVHWHSPPPQGIGRIVWMKPKQNVLNALCFPTAKVSNMSQLLSCTSCGEIILFYWGFGVCAFICCPVKWMLEAWLLLNLKHSPYIPKQGILVS